MTVARRQRPGAGATAGFTLMETLVALTLVALLVGSVLQALRWVGTASGFGRRAERAAEVQAGAAAFTDLLAGALPAVTGAASFAGDASSLAFDGVSDGTAIPPGRVRVAIGFQRGSTGGAIVVTIRPVLPAGSADANTNWTTVLIDGVREARFSYFGQAEERTPPGWSSSWSSRASQPSLVLAELALDGVPTVPLLPLNARVGRGPASGMSRSREVNETLP
ncbi:MAG: prepilin-type N-terminal cleavage/methylation domain-containing protein [Burkholderiales bacterium]|nr:prepilin-type N-terminal cleavage/methylation domain-containing protein [Burkholderiales bacterium]